MIDLMELEADANLAANYMLSIKRSLDLKRQWAIWEFKASLHQQEAEEATVNERAKIIHSRKDLDTKVRCAKVVMKAKYDYRMAIQEARMIRCSQLQMSEAVYLEALSENAATKSTQCTTLCRKHVKHMHELEERALSKENKLPRLSFHLSSHPTPCSAASQRESVHLLPHFVRAITFITSIYFIGQDTPGRGVAICSCFSQVRTQTVPMAKRQHSLPDPQGDTSMDETSSKASQEGPSSSKRRETTNWFASMNPSCTDAFSCDSNLVKEARSHYFATHPWDWIHGNTNDLSDIFRELAEGADLLGKSIYEIQLSWDGPEELKHANYFV